MCLFTHFPKDPNCEVCRMTKTTRQRLSRPQNIELEGNAARNGHRNALIIPNTFSYGFQSYPTKSKGSTETASCLQWFMLPSPKSRDNLHRQLAGVHVSVSRPEVQTWNEHSSSITHPWICGESLSKGTEGRAMIMVQSGFPEEWWNCAVEGTCETCTTRWPMVRQHPRNIGVPFGGQVIFHLERRSVTNPSLPRTSVSCISSKRNC